MRPDGPFPDGHREPARFFTVACTQRVAASSHGATSNAPGDDDARDGRGLPPTRRKMRIEGSDLDAEVRVHPRTLDPSCGSAVDLAEPRATRARSDPR